MDSTPTSRSVATIPTLRWRNVAASAVVCAIAASIYAFSPYNARQIDSVYGWVGFSLTGREFLVRATLGYLVLLTFYYLLERNPRTSKSLTCLQVAVRFMRAPAAVWREGLQPEERLAVRVTLLKSFFAPLMMMSLMVFLVSAIDNGAAVIESHAFDWNLLALFNRYGYWILIQSILFIDVFVFTIGYLVELPCLRNEIRSVDPTFLGWGVALICYPPFNALTGRILGSQVSDFPRFDDPTMHLSLNLALLTLMGIYASASVALGWKASNLTHRGIIARGPYAVVRHPAYICKNMAWWIGSIPLVSAAFGHSVVEGLESIASVVGWSMIYVLRALTEEDHLRSVDSEYAAYAEKVRKRFIPGVI